MVFFKMQTRLGRVRNKENRYIDYQNYIIDYVYLVWTYLKYGGVWLQKQILYCTLQRRKVTGIEGIIEIIRWRGM